LPAFAHGPHCRRQPERVAASQLLLLFLSARAVALPRMVAAPNWLHGSFSDQRPRTRRPSGHAPRWVILDSTEQPRRPRDAALESRQGAASLAGRPVGSER